MKFQISILCLIVSVSFNTLSFSQQKVGINQNNPDVSLDVSGRIKVGEETATATAGQIRWNSVTGDFEGYDGSKWVSFTAMSVIQGSVSSNTMQDIDGNVYPTVIIGTQEWMGENLRTTSYNDGSSIPYVNKKTVWRQLDNLQQHAYTWPDYDPGNKYPYGALYNGYAIQSGKLCPSGWKVPVQNDWVVLSGFLVSDQGGKMKQAGDLIAEDGLFMSTNVGANNSSGFSGIPAGFISGAGDPTSINILAFFGTSTLDSGNLITFWLSNSTTSLSTASFPLVNGFSIRCIKE